MWKNRSSVCYLCFCYCHNLICRSSSLYGNAPRPMYVSRPNFRNLLNYSFKEFKLFYSTDSHSQDDVKSLKKELVPGKAKKPKKELKTYITLLSADQSISVTTVEDAKKVASRRNLKLVKVTDFDPKTSRAVYQLMTESQYLKDDKEWSESKTKEKFIKGEKITSLTSSANENDVLTKVKMMKKWLNKRLEVKVVISGDSSSGEKIYKIIEQEIGTEGRLVQKRIKGMDIRFQVLPLKKTEEKKAENISESEIT